MGCPYKSYDVIRSDSICDYCTGRNCDMRNCKGLLFKGRELHRPMQKEQCDHTYIERIPFALYGVCKKCGQTVNI